LKNDDLNEFGENETSKLLKMLKFQHFLKNNENAVKLKLNPNISTQIKFVEDENTLSKLILFIKR
jgi:hypothetical protein